jgi:hypothetical protein
VNELIAGVLLLGKHPFLYMFCKGGRNMVNQKENASLATILEALSSTREEISQELDGLTDTQLNTKPKREKWSIVQNLHHLHLVEQAVTSSVTYALHKGETKDVPLKPVHVTTDRTHKREAPEQMKPTETIMKREQISGMLQSSRDKLLHTLHSIVDKQQLFEKVLQHPVFGELNLYQWLEFLDLHEQRHLEQIREAKRALLLQ